MSTRRIFSRAVASAALVVASLGVAAWPTGTAQAYARLSCHQPSAYNTYGKTAYVTGDYATAITNAGNDWTNTNSPVVVVPGSSSSQFYVDAYNYGNTGYDGITDSGGGCVGGHWAQPYAFWNTYYTNAYSLTNKRQVISHEIGHVLGLAHSGTSTCSGQPLMYYSSTRYTVCGHYTPQADDVAGVNAIY